MNLPFNVTAIVGYTYFICTDFFFATIYTHARDANEYVRRCCHIMRRRFAVHMDDIDIASVEYLFRWCVHYLVIFIRSSIATCRRSEIN